MISGGLFDVDSKEKRLKELEARTLETTFWQDQDKAKKILKEVNELKRIHETWVKTSDLVSEAEIMLDLAVEAKDKGALREASDKITRAQTALGQLEFQRMLSGEHDGSGAFLQINAGAGGTESCDWVSMLLRMYMRFCEVKGYKNQIVDFTQGDGAGYRSVTVSVEGTYAYGYLKAEIGVHRLVRISPFDANKRRHTSFASVFVYPDVEEDVSIDIKESDLRIDRYRAGGAGGQKVNVTDSAVRITHFPTGIVVQCQNERSQHQNKAMAMKILKARLIEHEMEKKQAERDKVEAEKKKIEWGSQIRSYVLQPYQMVKDHRTNYETGKTQDVLDGDLDEFIRRYLLMVK